MHDQKPTPYLCEIVQKDQQVRSNPEDAVNVIVVLLGEREWLLVAEDEGHMPGENSTCVDQGRQLSSSLPLSVANIAE